MSKAFTREDDDRPERPAAPRLPSPLPPGTRNYATPAGAHRLRAELERRLADPAAAGPAAPTNSDPRLQALQRSVQSMEIVPPPPPPHDQVRFGASVTVRDAQGVEERFRIVGVDETDAERDWISWLSPLARALLNARLGQRVRLKLPGGDRDLEVTAIAYE